MVILRQVMTGLPEWAETPEGAVNEMNEANNPALLFANQQIEIKGSLDTPVTGVSYDSRQVAPGSIFVCIPGLKADGHDFAAVAVERGASVLVVEHFLELPVTQVKVQDTRRALGLISAAFLGWPADKLRMIGVTGTNGKTTTTSLIEYMFNRAGRTTGLIGTLGARIGDAEFPGSRTTPEASDLQGLLAEMVNRQAGYAVMEVSSHALDLHRVAGVEYDVAVFTNLTQDHLDFHGNMAEYLAAKAKLFKGLGREAHKTGKKYAVINLDDSAGPKLAAATQVKAVTYGVNHAADYRAENILNQPTGVEFDAVFPGGTIRLALKTPGIFTVYNSLAAFAVGIEEG
ncbi:MAG TPA: UDP-N-acetylmuramyl-tripeptide synthetase, partial [Verrucomicrobiae bacterium]|nr:UDP-N-acetylmuramyl-tripeptide synthetase [Verrucomicrobiae bacterium]